MCGIVGKVTPSTREELLSILKEGFKALEHRGEDSYGIALYTGENFLFAKAIYLEEFLEKLEKEMVDRKIERVRWFIAHNRKRSTGSLDIETAHPVWTKEKTCFVIQNGTKKELYNLLDEALSDTHAIALLYPNVKEEFFFRILSGAGVVFVFDPEKKRILFHRDSSRTLFLNKEGIIASEPIRSGKWALIKEQDRVFKTDEEFSFKVSKWKKIEAILSELKNYCSACSTSKTISVKGDRDERCPVCYYLDKEARSTVHSYGTIYPYYHYQWRDI